MKRRALFTAAIALAALLVELGPASRHARADNTIPDLTMFPMYTGGSDSSFFGVVAVTFDITRQQGRHFWGVVTFDTGFAPIGFAFDGTVTPTPNEGLVMHEFKARGKSDAGVLMVEGTITPLGGDHFLIMFMYTFTSSMGFVDMGTMGFATNAMTGGD